MKLHLLSIFMFLLGFGPTMAGKAPTPIIPDDNPMTRPKIELGRRLFYDTRLSVTGAYACASCHIQAKAFSDGRKVAIGATGEKHRRNTPSLANVAFRPTLTWSHPRRRRLAAQLLIPLFGSQPVEMGMPRGGKELLSILNGDAVYRDMFSQAFDNAITMGNFAKALAAFQRSLISFDAPYDRPNSMSSSAKRGAALFFSDRLNCFQCHPAPHFTDNYKSKNLPLEEIAFHNTGVSKTGGLFEHTGQSGDQGRFRTPSLRNVAVTQPYMHDGGMATLTGVIEFYAGGGRANPNKSSYLTGFKISKSETDDLIEFLITLTDKKFLTNPAHGNPFAGKN